jgi:hypothetical protein
MRTIKNIIDIADIELDKELEKLHQKYEGSELMADELYTALDTVWHKMTDLLIKFEEVHIKKDHQ